MVTMAQNAMNWPNMHSHGSHVFTHTLNYINTVTTTWCEALAQLLFFSACLVFSCFGNPPNSDMDYRIFNVRMWAFLSVRIHKGVGHSESAQHFWLRKTHIFLVLLTGFEPLSFGSGVWCSTFWATPGLKLLPVSNAQPRTTPDTTKSQTIWVTQLHQWESR